MNRSFAQFTSALQLRRLRLVHGVTTVCVVFTLAACATLPPPTGELDAAQQAVAHASGADADQYAATAIAQARNELTQAQAALQAGRDDDARALALAAAADADLAYARSNAAITRSDFVQHRDEIDALRQRLQMPAETVDSSPLDDATPAAPAASTGGATPADAAIGLAGRLRTLEADPRLNAVAAYERLLAHQALDALTAARGRNRAAAAQLADHRVAIAELAARTQATRRLIDTMERTRSDLLVEASRQDAERARREAEQLRIQAQVQAEEAQRLREQADAEAAARQQAEDVIIDVGATQAAKLKAARAKEADLARQEAALEAATGADRAPAKSGSSTKSASKKKKKPI
jgi:hypothetical protein